MVYNFLKKLTGDREIKVDILIQIKKEKTTSSKLKKFQETMQLTAIN